MDVAVASVVGHTLAGRAFVLERASCPLRRAAQHPPLLRGIVTLPPAPSSLTRLPVVRALFCARFFCGGRALDGGRCKAGLGSSLRALFYLLCGPLLG